MKIPNKLIKSLGAVAIASVLGVSAFAHTISMGSFNAGTPGSVSVVMGTYDHGGAIFQGSISLIAGPTVPPTVTQAFTSVLLTQPLGLIDGVNNFYADATSATWGSLASDSYNSATNNVGLGSVVNWQMATFTGLSAGTYTYQLSGMTSANWNNINSFQDNWTGTLVIPEESVSGVPDGGASLILLGIGLSAIGFVGSRKPKKIAT